MRYGALLFTLALSGGVATAGAQALKVARDIERFEVTGLPQSPSSDLEKEIFLLLRVHKKGDLIDASRIHAKLGQFYRERGDQARSDVCNRLAMEAYEAGSGERSPSAGSPANPPFEPRNTMAMSFTHVDEALRLEHLWHFFEDGTFAHSVTSLEKLDLPGPRELGWYTIDGNRMRLWQFRPRSDKTVSWESLGDREGARMDGVVMRAIR